MTRAHIDHPDLAFAGHPKRGCADRPDLTWFPARGDNGPANAARAVCATCPVVEECKAWGLHREHHGIFGGLTEHDRRPIRLALGITVESPHVTTPVPCGTEQGYAKHRRNHETVCDPCRLAYNAAGAKRQAEYRARRKGTAA